MKHWRGRHFVRDDIAAKPSLKPSLRPQIIVPRARQHRSTLIARRPERVQEARRISSLYRPSTGAGERSPGASRRAPSLPQISSETDRPYMYRVDPDLPLRTFPMSWADSRRDNALLAITGKPRASLHVL